MKHTPGPWMFNESTRQITGNNDDGCIVVREVMHQIYDERLETEEMNANAKLIVAAPDLLEEHKALISRVETMASALIRKGLGIWVTDWLSDGILNGKAIKKAEA